MILAIILIIAAVLLSADNEAHQIVGLLFFMVVAVGLLKLLVDTLYGPEYTNLMINVLTLYLKVLVWGWR